MAQRIYVSKLGEYVSFPDDMSQEDMAKKIKELIASSGGDEETDLWDAAKYGARTIIPKIKEGYGKQIEGALNYLPLPESWESGPRKFAERMREDAAASYNTLNKEFIPDTLPEKVMAGLSGAGGDIATLAPWLVGAGAAVAAAPVSLPAAGAAAVTGALGLGAHGLVEGYSEGDLEEAAKRGGIGAAEGAAFGLLGPVGKATQKAFGGSALAGHLGKATGAGAIGGTSAAAQGADAEDVAASAATMFALAGLTERGAPRKTSKQRLEELAANAAEAKRTGNLEMYDALQARLQEQSIGVPKESVLDRIPGVKESKNWLYEKWINKGRLVDNLVSEAQKNGY